jgi:hypothetical protein
MDETLQERAGRNEALFRDTNEAIARGHWPDDLRKVVRFRCECARLDCGESVGASLAQYEQVRQHPRRFLVAVGHQVTEFEDVVGVTDDYLIVEKRAIAGEVAAAKDPRG